MKTLIGIIIIALIAYGAYTMWGPNKGSVSGSSSATKTLTSPEAQAKNESLDQYEALIASYEDRGGLKNQNDMMQFVADMQRWATTWTGDMSGVSADEASYLQNRLQSLTARQMKMMGR